MVMLSTNTEKKYRATVIVNSIFSDYFYSA